MKKVAVLILLVGLGINSFGQEEPSKKMPPMSMLPKDGEMKRIYELPDSTDYKIYNQKGDLIESGNAEFVDITDYKKGTYFIIYDDKKMMFSSEGKRKNR